MGVSPMFFGRKTRGRDAHDVFFKVPNLIGEAYEK